MTEGTKSCPRCVVVCAAIGVIGLGFVTEGAVAQTSEIDSYDRAVTSQRKEYALAFLKEFRSSHLVVDLIESLRPDVAREVCANLPSGVSAARRACEQLREAPVPSLSVSSEDGQRTAMQPSASVPPPAPTSNSTQINGGTVGTISRPVLAPPTPGGSSTTIAAEENAATVTPAQVAPELIEPAAGNRDLTVASTTMGAATPTQTVTAVPGYRIQLLSTKSRAEAENAWQELQMAYPDLLRDLEFSVSEVDLGAANGGVWYRGIADPLASVDEANVLCIVVRSSPPYQGCSVAHY